MADRKVLVKYYPPDFDPQKLAQKSRLYRNIDAKRKKGDSKLMNVRFMFPFTMCCATCNEFIYIGTKFNSRVERIKGKDYLGITIWRFYGHCPHCRGDIQFKTDPQNTEYILESGGTRTYDQRKDAALAEESLKGKLEEELGDTMAALEHKTSTTANELITLEQLDELRKINKRMLDRESTLEDAINWLKTKTIQAEEKKYSEELKENDMDDLERAKEEIEERKFRLLQEQEVEEIESDDICVPQAKHVKVCNTNFYLKPSSVKIIKSNASVENNIKNTQNTSLSNLNTYDSSTSDSTSN